MRLGVFTASPIAPFLGAVQIPLIHPIKLGISGVAPLSHLLTVSERARYGLSIIVYQEVIGDT
ncbi:MAG: hypothetical protein VX078_13755 [Pseudomonadota bacterium]|nr:hypothetical protein [Pseudomonadota bacterium]